MKAPELFSNDSNSTRPSLLARLRNQEHSSTWEQGWREFFDVYRGILVQYARHQGLSREDADDLAQEILAGAAERMPTFRYDPVHCRFKTWLFRIARNKVVDHWRRRHRRLDEIAGDPCASDGSVPDEVEDLGGIAPDAAWDLTFEAVLQEAALERVVKRVDPMNMRLYLFHVVDGHSIRETVQRFRDSGVTPTKVYLAKFRIRRQVDKELAQLRLGGIRP